MTDVRPISAAPISAMGVTPLAPPPPADLFSGVLCYFDTDAIFLNVLEDGGVGSFPNGDAIIRNLLESAFSGSDAAALKLRMAFNVGDSAGLADLNESTVLIVIKERVLATTGTDVRATFKSALNDGGGFTDAISAAWSMLLADAGDSSDANDVILRKLAVVADTLNAMALVDGKLTAYSAVAVAATLEDRIASGWNASAFDQAAFADATTALVQAIAALDDAATVADSAVPQLRMLVLSSENANIADDPATTLRAMEDLADGAIGFVTLRLGGNDYQGWALNTDLRAVTEYRNVPFDSFAMLGGRTYAAGEDGIFELTGDTDDGQPIEAWFRPFLSNFGTQKMKRVTDIWIGSRAAGLYVKVHTRDPATGNMAEDIYPVQHTHGIGTEKARVKVGRGLVSDRWTLTVGNVAGADFDVDGIEWKPLVLDRRQ